MRIVVLRALGLGDFLTAVPAYRAILRAFRRDRVDLAAPAVFTPLARLLGELHVNEARGLNPLDPSLWDADVAINLHGTGPQSHRLLLQSRPRKLLAYSHQEVPESARGPTHDANEHEVERWCRLVRAFGIEADSRELDLPRPPVTVPKRFRDATLLHVGAGAGARRWPAARWGRIATELTRAGERVLVTAGEQEVQMAHDVARQAHVSPTRVLAGRTTLLELAAVVAAAKRVVCTDTGVAHLATAYRIPSVVLFGPSAPSVWGPPPDRTWHRVLWSGSTGNPNAAETDVALMRVTPEEVLAAVARLPERAP
jgi:ADP-heptose:LPS heptosyltransferase